MKPKNKKTKIVHVITSLAVGGAEKSLFNLLNYGLDDCFDNIVISLQGEGFYGSTIRKMGIPVYTLDMRQSYPTLKAIIQLYNFSRRLRPDILQGWMYHGNLAAYMLKRMFHYYPLFVMNVRHTLDALENEKLLTRQVIRINRWFSYRSDAIVYNSQVSCDLHSLFGFSNKNNRIIFNGFDTEKFRPDLGCKLRVRKALGISETARVIGHVGRFHPMKDHARFLRAAVRILDSQNDIHVLLVGREVTNENLSLFEAVPDRLKNQVHFLGERMDIPELMRAMDIFVSSSQSEAFPNVLGEAMSTALACLATNVGDSQAITGDTGFVIPPKDDHALFFGLNELLKKTDQERQDLGMAARARIIENYSLKKTVDQYIELYQQISMTSKGLRACVA